ncbi:MAG: Asp23/Gls24 family envelope stress response protein [Chlamydiales bacterium]|nr:Asp23/Gls24 family envelope stress response protein [Chlamydiales bacterium]
MAEQTKFDSKEFEVPKTVFSHDIETRVIQVIILHCLNKIGGVSLMGGTLIDTLFGRGDVERVKGIFVEQDSKNHLVKVKIEVNVEYGMTIPEISQKVQNQVVEEITKLTGLHVASVHLVVKGLISRMDMVEHQEDMLYPASLIPAETESTD